MMKQINLEELATVLINQATSQRILVAIAGPPGVGKSTITHRLSQLINKLHVDMCSILAMDSYHYDDIYLDEMGWKAQKGAQHTFDVDGLLHMLSRLKANKEQQIAVPVFDRSIEIARAAASMIPQSVNIVLIEGNYLLLNQAPWDKLGKYFDTSVMLKASQVTLEKRLNNRWGSYGFSTNEISSKLNENDIPNVQTVINLSFMADYFIINDGANCDKNN